MPTEVLSAAQASAADKRRRIRKAASCNSCRASKSRCDRGLPCSACVSRGHECVWAADAAPPLYTARDKNETESLRREVERLQGLIDVLVSGNAPGAGSPGELSRLPSYHQTSGSSHSAHSSDGGGTGGSPERESRGRSVPLPSAEDDLNSIDLASKLGKLSLATFRVGANKDEDGHDPRPEPIIQEARSLLDDSLDAALTGSNEAAEFGFKKSPNYGLLPLGNRLTLKQIMTRLPRKQLTLAPAATYWAAIAWYLHAIPFPVWEKHLEHVYSAHEAGEDADPFSLANVFAIWAAGLGSMTVEEAAAQGIHNKLELTQEWLELASGSLACGHFLESPTIEAIRPLLLLSVYYVCLSPGDDGSSGVAYIALAVQCGLQLGLHRDPAKSPGRWNAFQTDDRRRTFWLMYSVDQVISTTFARGYTLLHARNIDTKMPADVPDELMGQPEPAVPTDNMISHLIIRIKLAQLAERISDVAYGINPVTYAQILELDKEVRQYEADIPTYYDFATFETVQDPLRAARILTIKLCVAQELLRLHRPYLARSLTDETYARSRFICLDCSRVILKILANPICATPWCGLLYKAICSCIVLGIDLIQLPNGPDAPSHRAYIDNALHTIEAHAKASTVCRRGLKLIRLLLSKDPLSNAPRPDEPAHFKRGRTNSGARGQVGAGSPTYGPGESSLAGWNGSQASPPVANIVIDDRHRKRPTGAPVAYSEETVSPSGPRPAQPLRSRTSAQSAPTVAPTSTQPWSAAAAAGQATAIDGQIDFASLLGYDEGANLSGRPQWSVADSYSFFDPTPGAFQVDFTFAPEPVGFGSVPPPPMPAQRAPLQQQQQQSQHANQQQPATRPAPVQRQSSGTSVRASQPLPSVLQPTPSPTDYDFPASAAPPMPSRIPAAGKTSQVPSSQVPVFPTPAYEPAALAKTSGPAADFAASAPLEPATFTIPSAELPTAFLDASAPVDLGYSAGPPGEDLFSPNGLLGSVGIQFDDLSFPYDSAAPPTNAQL